MVPPHGPCSVVAATSRRRGVARRTESHVGRARQNGRPHCHVFVVATSRIALPDCHHWAWAMGGHQHRPPHHDTNCYDPCPLPTGPAPTTFRSGGVLTTCAHFSPTTTTPLVWHPTRDRARAVRRSGARHQADPCSTPQNLSGGLLRASGGLDTLCL